MLTDGYGIRDCRRFAGIGWHRFELATAVPIEFAHAQLQRLSNRFAEHLLFEVAKVAIMMTARQVWVGARVDL